MLIEFTTEEGNVKLLEIDPDTFEEWCDEFPGRVCEADLENQPKHTNKLVE